MKLAALRIQNFRCAEDVTVNFSDYTCLVGPNGAGKSTVLAALNVLFRAYRVGDLPAGLLSEEDFHHRDVSKPVVITATFDSLSSEAIESFSAYVRHGRLVINAKAEWDAVRGQAEVRQYGARLVMQDFVPFFDAIDQNAKVDDLRSIYTQCRAKYSDLPAAASKAAMVDALRAFEEGHRDLCELVDSADQFYGWSKGANKLEPHIQWVYVPAVKDASTEQDEGKNTALGLLLQRVMGERTNFNERLTELRRQVEETYRRILHEEESGLDELSKFLETRLQEWAHPGALVKLQWHQDPAKSVSINLPFARAKVGEDRFIGDVSRLGHGLQRSFIVSLLQGLASDEGASGPRLLLGFEEPELYQHPPQARHLAGVLEELSGHNTQVIVTTHSPLFVSSRGFESVRMARKTPQAQTTITSMTYDKLGETLAAALGEAAPPRTAVMAKTEQIMQPSQNELFFTKRVVLVEGPEDVTFITTHLQLTSRWHEFRRLGFHFVIAEGKTNLSRPLAIANGFGIPAFVVFDGDAGKEQAEHRRDNRCLLALCEYPSADPLPSETFWGDRVVMWATDIGDTVMKDVGTSIWNTKEQQARREYGLTHGIRRKNNLLIAATLEVLDRDGIRSPVLDQLCDAILHFGGSHERSTEATGHAASGQIAPLAGISVS